MRIAMMALWARRCRCSGRRRNPCSSPGSCRGGAVVHPDGLITAAFVTDQAVLALVPGDAELVVDEASPSLTSTSGTLSIRPAGQAWAQARPHSSYSHRASSGLKRGAHSRSPRYSVAGGLQALGEAAVHAFLAAQAAGGELGLALYPGRAQGREGLRFRDRVESRGPAPMPAMPRNSRRET